MVELVDTRDLKSLARNSVRVRFPLAAPQKNPRIERYGDFFILWKMHRAVTVLPNHSTRRIFLRVYCYHNLKRRILSGCVKIGEISFCKFDACIAGNANANYHNLPASLNHLRFCSQNTCASILDKVKRTVQCNRSISKSSGIVSSCGICHRVEQTTMGDSVSIMMMFFQIHSRIIAAVGILLELNSAKENKLIAGGCLQNFFMCHSCHPLQYIFRSGEIPALRYQSCYFVHFPSSWPLPGSQRCEGSGKMHRFHSRCTHVRPALHYQKTQ